MKIKKIEIKNFRQFLDTELNFDTDSKSKIHLVVGTNGAGKTTLLSAVYLGLYGRVLDSMVTSDLSNINVFQALAENETTSTTVGIYFSHGDSDYYLRRFIKVRKNLGKEDRFQEELVLKNITSGEPIPTAQRWINRRFPANLAKFLLFPGEILEGFFKSSKLDSLSKDIKALAGLDRFELLENAAEKVKRQLSDHIKNIPDDAVVGRLLAEIESVESQVKQLRIDEATAVEAVSTLQTELRTQRQILSQHMAESQALQEVEASEQAVAEIENQLSRVESELTSFVSAFGWVAFVRPLANAAENRIAALERDGALGSKWPNTLLSELIENGNCLCGCALADGSPEKAAVQRLMGGQNEVENSINYLVVRDSLRSGALSFVDASDKYLGLLGDQRSLQSKLDAAQVVLEEKRSELGSSGDESWLSRVANRVTKIERDELPMAEKLLQDTRNTIETCDVELRDLNKKLSDISSRSDSHGALMRQRQALENVMSAVRQSERDSKELLRRRLQGELQKRLAVVYDQDLKVEVSQSFDITVKQKGQVLNEAGGQGQLRSVITSVVLNNIAKEFSLDSPSDGSAADFPLVIDAAFNKMATNMTKIALEVLAESSSQVILLLLHDQAKVPIQFLTLEGFASTQLLAMHQVGAGENEVWNDSGLPSGDPTLKYFNSDLQRTEGVQIDVKQ